MPSHLILQNETKNEGSKRIDMSLQKLIVLKNPWSLNTSQMQNVSKHELKSYLRKVALQTMKKASEKVSLFEKMFACMCKLQLEILVVFASQ
jgi:hypothetical protein